MTLPMEISIRKATSSRSAKVFITSAYTDSDPIDLFREIAKQDKIRLHTVIDNPDDADIILFVENSRFHEDFFFKRLLEHPLLKKYPEKTFMYNPHDVPWYLIRGLYANMPRKIFDNTFIAAAPYFEIINDFIFCDMKKEPKYLYSFFGAPSSPVRKKVLMSMKHHERSYIKYSRQHTFFEPGVKPKDPQLQYAEMISDTKFPLAPCGIGTSSIRLFEILKAGRVPVILSDQLVLPAGPDWNKIAVVIPEKDVELLPSILEKIEPEWPERAAMARKAWEDYFAPETVFHYFIESILDIKPYDYHLSDELKRRNMRPYYRYAFRKRVIERVKPVLKSMGLFRKKH